MNESKESIETIAEGPIRILHFADLHIGMETYGSLDAETGLNRRVVDFLDRLDELIDYALEHQADVVLFAGDAFRNRSPAPTYQREFAQRIRRLSEAKIPTVLLVGNHDVPVMEQRASSVEIFDALAVPYVTVAEKAELLRLETARGPVQIATLPYPVRQRLLTREQYRRMDQESLDRAVTEAVVGIIEQLSAEIDPEIPRSCWRTSPWKAPRGDRSAVLWSGGMWPCRSPRSRIPSGIMSRWGTSTSIKISTQKTARPSSMPAAWSASILARPISPRASAGSRSSAG